MTELEELKKQLEIAKGRLANYKVRKYTIENYDKNTIKLEREWATAELRDLIHELEEKIINYNDEI